MPAPKKLSMLTREAILDADDIREEIVDVPEWGGQVKVRGFSIATQAAIDDQAVSDDGTIDNARHHALLMIHGIAEPELQASDVEKLKERSLSAANRVAAAINRCNGEGQIAEAEARFLEGE